LSLDCHLALQLETKFDEERDSRDEVGENDAGHYGRESRYQDLSRPD
jgi:hypothetical protein